MRQAIVTKYLGPTNTLGARIKASAGHARGLVDHWDYEAGVEENHARVAKVLAADRGWSGLFVAGMLPSGDGNVFTALPDLHPSDTFETPRAYLGIEGRDWFYLPARAG